MVYFQQVTYHPQNRQLSKISSIVHGAQIFLLCMLNATLKIMVRQRNIMNDTQCCVETKFVIVWQFDPTELASDSHNTTLKCKCNGPSPSS